ncbi:type II secretion system F family protein [Pseudactinotalea sp. Z1748]|uniref:type II secretion system F family protein n=1 Tax=Pseudactinotalea sp. Z1748 TaxID=3413027 RepID=UPI003C7C949D
MTALLLGLGLTCAVMALLAAFIPLTDGRPKPKVATPTGRLWTRLANDAKLRRKVIVAVVLGVSAWVITGVPILAVLVPAAAMWLPSLMRKPVDSANSGLLEDLESWTRTVAGLLATGEPLERAMARSVDSTGQTLKEPVSRLSARLSAQQPLERAMRLWADEVDDSLADMVAATIIIGARRRAGGVQAALDGLGRTMTERLELRRQIDAEGTESRTVAWFMTIFTTGLAVLGSMHPTIASAYSTASGQVLLVVLVAVYVGLLVVMRKLATVPADGRLFQPLSGSTR